MIGAPMLAALAAYRSGCGYVVAALPREVLVAGLAVVPEAVGLGVEDDDGLAAAAGSADAVAVGPGLGRQAEGAARVARLLEAGRPVVVDADAINALGPLGRWPDGLPAGAVLTPHPGEARRLTGEAVPTDDDGRLDYANRHAAAAGVVLVLKGERTVVVDGRDGRASVNTTGDSTLAKAGSGDVLTGVLGALLAQGHDPFDAACWAVAAHGTAGEAAGRRWTKRGALARDVCDELPAALAALE
jgi:NAD(P)H-hydrate epimerase